MGVIVTANVAAQRRAAERAQNGTEAQSARSLEQPGSAFRSLLEKLDPMSVGVGEDCAAPPL